MTTETDSSGRPIYIKDPDSVLDYSRDWAGYLSDIEDSIVDFEGIVSSGDVTIDSYSYSGTVTSLWISGGTVGVNSIVTFRITTAAGRVDDRSIVLKIKDR